MKESNRLSDFKATVILTALAVLMLGTIWWGLSNPASSKAADKFEVILVTEGCVTTNAISPEALVGPNERVELDTLQLDRTDFEFAVPPQMPIIPDFNSAPPNTLMHTPSWGIGPYPEIHDTTDAEGK